MEPNDYIKHIEMDIYYYTQIHRMPPIKIFISNVLLSKIIISCYGIKLDETCVAMCFGVPVQVYNSDKLEYYLSSSGFEFNE